MQENRSFDSYFGTYPGADGLPRRDGRFTVCSPDPRSGLCFYPYHDARDRNSGGPHEHLDAIRDINDGKMNGFVREARRGLGIGCGVNPDAPLCSFGAAHPDVMGYHDAREIPNYWAYARHFVLQDHMFQPDTSWSLPAHLFMVSEWSARCRTHATVELRQRDREPAGAAARAAEPDRPQADLRLDRSHLPAAQAPRLLALLRRQGRAARLRRRRHGLQAGRSRTPARPGSGTRCRGSTRSRPTTSCATSSRCGSCSGWRSAARLPAVSWVIPSNRVSEHPPSLVTRRPELRHERRQRDHAQPGLELDRDLPRLGRLGRLLRPRRAAEGGRQRLRPARARARDLAVRPPRLRRPPGAELRRLREVHRGRLPRARRGSTRPSDGRPDPRPTVRENVSVLGNLVSDFNFSQKPRRPLLLPLHPPFS